MVAVTLDTELGAGRLDASEAGTAPVTQGKSVFTRLFDAFTRSQMMRAERSARTPKECFLRLCVLAPLRFFPSSV